MFKCTLKDMALENHELEFEVEATYQGIVVRPKGYGDFCSNDGKGCPIFIELYEGHPRVTIWDDINNEDSSHTIELDKAQESLRVEDDEWDIAN